MTKARAAAEGRNSQEETEMRRTQPYQVEKY